jgi:hypothetical protein
MALSATTQWDVRTTGSDSNGGGFDPASTGTDYSQQDSPQVAYTDLVIGATTTQLTSSAHPFTSAHVGNVMKITGGTGFTVQRVQINSVSSGVATCDKSCGTASSTGGTGNLGGSVATPGAAPLVAGNTLWLKTGTYTLTVPLFPGQIQWNLYGYSSTHGDNGTATLTTATDSTPLIHTPAGQPFNIANIAFTNTATTKSDGMTGGGSGADQMTVTNCSFTGLVNGINAYGTTLLAVHNTAITGGSGNAIATSGALIVSDSFISGNGVGLSISSSPNAFVINTVIVNGTGNGIFMNGAGVFTLLNSTVANNASHGISVNGSLVGLFRFQSNVVYGNGGKGINGTGLTYSSLFLSNNAWGSNASGNYGTGIPAGAGDKTLTADPFTNSAGGDYSLNSTAGGGALCKGAGFPGVFPGGTTTGHLDIGAVQSTGSGGGSTPVNYGFVG